jgi:hypothetical protein
MYAMNMPQFRLHTIISGLVALVMLATFSACMVGMPAGRSASSTPTVTPIISAVTVSNVPITIYSAMDATTGTPNNHESASVSCTPGEQMVGGGFVAGDVFEYAAFIAASYPSGPNTWVVSGDSISHFQLAAEVYCVPARPDYGVQIVHTAVSGEGDATCPQGSVLLSGGFQTGDRQIAVSQPQGNGWNVAANTTATAYALCATHHVTPEGIATASLAVHSSQNGDTPGEATAECPSGAIAVGGGFSGGGLALSSATQKFTGWSVSAGGDFTQTISAVCTIFAVA